MKESNQVPINDSGNDIENPCIPLVTKVTEKLKLDRLPPVSSYSSCCIYKVPERLKHGTSRYAPQVVSIGPFHHGKDHLKAMEEHKKRYLKDYLNRTNERLETYIKKIKGMEERLRRCYAEEIKFGSEDFVTIILVDAAFIIEVLLRHRFRKFIPDDDPVFCKPRMFHDIWPDIRLLENQLPFFILEELYDPIRVSSDMTERLSLYELSLSFFKTRLMNINLDEAEGSKRCSKIEHFVDLIRWLYELYMPKQLPSAGKLQTISIPSMTELHRAGVKVKVRKTKNLFDIQFTDGILQIPKLKISEETELTIRNLLAFEQCHCIENYISDYVFLMDRFVNTPSDVELLVKYGVVENMLGDSTEGSALFNSLVEEAFVEPRDFHYATLCDKLNEYCKTPWHRWRANLKQNYFNTPWATMSVIAAVVLLILTLIQTSPLAQVEDKLEQDYFTTPWVGLSVIVAAVLLVLIFIQTVTVIVVLIFIQKVCSCRFHCFSLMLMFHVCLKMRKSDCLCAL